MSRRALIAVVILCGVSLISLALVLLRPAPPEPPPVPGLSAGGAGPGIAVKQGHFVGRSGGERRWEIVAGTVTARQGESRMELEGIQDGVFYDKGEAWLRFSAARARVDPAAGDLELEDVHFTSRSGDRLSADILTWREDRGKVVIEGNVRIERGPGAVLLCDRAEYRPGDNVLEALGRTTLEIEIDDDR